MFFVLFSLCRASCWMAQRYFHMISCVHTAFANANANTNDDDWFDVDDDDDNDDDDDDVDASSVHYTTFHQIIE